MIITITMPITDRDEMSLNWPYYQLLNKLLEFCELFSY